MEPIRSSRGFTLIEMLVVLAIITVLAAVVLTSQSAFNKSLVLANAAYDVALTVRSAESYGLGTKAVGSFANAGYGLDFAKTTPNSFTLFFDTYPTPSASNCHGLPSGGASAPDAKSGNCVYDAAQGEKVSTYTLGNGITVSDFCAKVSGSWRCANSGASQISSLDIVFLRPNADVFMSVNGSYSAVSPVTAACLSLTSPQGGARFLSVGATGQIIANASSCP